MAIANDREFKAALAALNDCQRRQATAHLVRQALDLTDDARVRAGGRMQPPGSVDPGRAPVL